MGAWHATCFFSALRVLLLRRIVISDAKLLKLLVKKPHCDGTIFRAFLLSFLKHTSDFWRLAVDALDTEGF